jgi:hypothetical protein
VCHQGRDYISPRSIPTLRIHTPHDAPKPLALSNENDYHLHIWVWASGRPCHERLATGGIMRTRQDIWLGWATGILVALGIVAIAAGSVLIAWMSLNPL